MYIPLRSLNNENKMKKVMCYKKCNFVEGTINILDEEFKHMEKTQ